MNFQIRWNCLQPPQPLLPENPALKASWWWAEGRGIIPAVGRREEVGRCELAAFGGNLGSGCCPGPGWMLLCGFLCVLEPWSSGCSVPQPSPLELSCEHSPPSVWLVCCCSSSCSCVRRRNEISCYLLQQEMCNNSPYITLSKDVRVCIPQPLRRMPCCCVCLWLRCFSFWGPGQGEQWLCWRERSMLQILCLLIIFLMKYWSKNKWLLTKFSQVYYYFPTGKVRRGSLSGHVVIGHIYLIF